MGFSKMRRPIEMITVNPISEIKKFKNRQFINKIKIAIIVAFVLFSLVCLFLNSLGSVQAIPQDLTIEVINDK